MSRKIVQVLAVLMGVLLATPSLFAVAPGGVYREGDSAAVVIDPAVFPHTLGYHVVRGTWTYHGRKLNFASGIFLPPAFFKTKQPMPIVMGLHNRFAIGLEGSDGMVGEGFGQMLAHGQPDGRAEGDKPANPISLREDAQFIGLHPQCPAGLNWEDPVMANVLCEFIDLVVKHYQADDDRVYLTGFSYGASSTWRVALNAPHRFAAIICCDGRATPDPVNDVAKLAHLPIYLEVGQWDGDFVAAADQMHQALNTLPHRDFIFHQIPGGNHFNYQAVYNDPEVWKWVLSKRRSHQVSSTVAPTRTAVPSDPLTRTDQ